MHRRRQANPLQQDASTEHSNPESSEILFGGISATLLSVLFFFSVVILLSVHNNNWLPTALGVDAPPQVFSEGRAREHVRAITSLGVRTVGSRANEELTPALLLERLNQMEARAAAAGMPNFAKTSVQRPASGAYSSSFLNGFTNVYANVTNVLVFCGPRGASSSLLPTVLLGAHFDSAVGAPAASDDTAMVGVLLEVIRVILSGPRLTHGVVVNLNGAEETNWMAAHGFVSSGHEWASSLKFVLNLEAVGSGGRDHILQAGPKNDWIMRAYAAGVPHPHGSSVVQDIFEIPGVIPGQTDFQVYRDYGGCVGIELVWLARGEVYHTANDVEAAIPAGALQHTGENVLGLLSEVLRSAELHAASATQGEKAVFFDVLGVLFISYTASSAVILNYFFVFVALGRVCLSPRFNSATTAAAAWLLLLRTLYGIGCPLLVGLTLATCGHSLAWYAHSTLALVLYASSSLFGMAVGHASGHQPLLRALHEHDIGQRSYTGTSAANLLIDLSLGGFALLVLALTTLGVHTAFMGTIWGGVWLARLMAPLPLAPLTHAHSSGSKAAAMQARWACAILAACFVPVAVWLQHLLLVAEFVLPLMGRSGSLVPPEPAVGCLIGVVCTGLSCVPFCVLHASVSRDIWKGVIRGAATVTTCCLIISLFLFPYSERFPKRLIMQHVLQQTSHSSASLSEELHVLASIHSSAQRTTAALWINSMDSLQLDPVLKSRALAPLTRRITGNPVPREVSCNGPQCLQPWYFPVWSMLGNGWWLGPAEPPSLGVTESMPFLEILSDRRRNSSLRNSRVLRIVMSGPSQMGLILPRSVKRWSFNTPVPLPRSDCDCHFVFFASGSSMPSWGFELEFVHEHENAPLQLIYYGHYLETRSVLLEEVEAELPSWITPVSFISIIASLSLPPA